MPNVPGNPVILKCLFIYRNQTDDNIVVTFLDTGNYDIPRSPATSDYDIPRAVSQEDGNYDVPRSSEDLRMSRADEFDYDVPNDIPV